MSTIKLSVGSRGNVLKIEENSARHGSFKPVNCAGSSTEPFAKGMSKPVGRRRWKAVAPAKCSNRDSDIVKAVNNSGVRE